MIKQDLVAAGYKQFPNRLANQDTHKWDYQKLIVDPAIGYGKDYFITIEEWDWQEFKDRMGPDHPRFTYSPHVHFRLNNGMDIKVSLFTKFSTTVKEMEDFYWDMFKKMGFERNEQ